MKHRIKHVLLSGIAIILSFSMAMQVLATETLDQLEQQQQEAQNIANQLAGQRNRTQAERDQIAEELNRIIAEIEDVQVRISDKMDEIEIAESELFSAMELEFQQYEAMKMRIRFMFENGDFHFIEILMSSTSIADLLNRAEYISKVSEYDRNMLIELQTTVQLVEDRKAQLEEENLKLQELHAELADRERELDELLAAKEVELSEIQGLIGANAARLSNLRQQIADEQARIEEARRQAEEAARREREEADRRAREQAEREAAANRPQPPASGNNNSGNSGNNVVGTGSMTHPAPGTRLTSGFGNRVHPIFGGIVFHAGIDLAGPIGTPVLAADSGTVISTGFGWGSGNFIIINHGGGITTRYFHLNTIEVSAGQTVTRGQRIGTVGNTGNSTGPHLHFEVHVNGSPVNPLQFL